MLDKTSTEIRVCPVFTTSRSGFMASTEDCNQEFIDRMSGEKRLVGFAGQPLCGVYIDGTLEDLVGYDIPIWLSGEIHNVPQQKCVVWSVEGTQSWDALLTMGEHQYITLPEEAEDGSQDE